MSTIDWIRWTPEHELEALAQQCEIAAEFIRAGDVEAAKFLVELVGNPKGIESADRWCITLAVAGLSRARQLRELRRVDVAASARNEEKCRRDRDHGAEKR